MQASRPDPRPGGAERYMRLIHPVVRGCRGIAVAVAVLSAAGAIGGRAGLVLASTCLAFLGSYCLLNFHQCRETHCAVTGPGLTLAALIGLTAALAPGSALAWYRVSCESIAAITICTLGYGLEWAVASRTGRHALR